MTQAEQPKGSFDGAFELARRTAIWVGLVGFLEIVSPSHRAMSAVALALILTAAMLTTLKKWPATVGVLTVGATLSFVVFGVLRVATSGHLTSAPWASAWFFARKSFYLLVLAYLFYCVREIREHHAGYAAFEARAKSEYAERHKSLQLWLAALSLIIMGVKALL